MNGRRGRPHIFIHRPISTSMTVKDVLDVMGQVVEAGAPLATGFGLLPEAEMVSEAIGVGKKLYNILHPPHRAHGRLTDNQVESKLRKSDRVALQEMQEFRHKHLGAREPRHSLVMSESNSITSSDRPYVLEIKDEYLFQLNRQTGSAGTGNIYQLHINPGNHGTFPWLHTIASKYMNYFFTHLEFTYHPTTAATVSGGVALAANYGINHMAPTDLAAFSNAADKAIGPLYDRVTLVCDPKSLMTGLSNKFVRTGANPYNYALQDAGHMYITTFGAPDTAMAGYISVSYRVVFSGMLPDSLDIMLSLPYQKTLFTSSTVVNASTIDVITAFSQPLDSPKDATLNVQDLGGAGANTVILLPWGVWHIEIYAQVIHESGASAPAEWRVQYGNCPLSTATTIPIVADQLGITDATARTVGDLDTCSGFWWLRSPKVNNNIVNQTGNLDSLNGFQVLLANYSSSPFRFNVRVVATPA